MSKDSEDNFQVSLDETSDDDLDELLDSALSDFDKHSKIKPQPKCSETSLKESVGSVSDDVSDETVNSDEAKEFMSKFFEEDFAMMNLMSNLQESVKSMFNEAYEGSDSELSEQFSNDIKKIAEDALGCLNAASMENLTKNLNVEASSSKPDIVTAALSETLKNLSETPDSKNVHVGASNSTPNKVSATLSETLKNLSENAGSLQEDNQDAVNLLDLLFQNKEKNSTEGDAATELNDYSSMINSIMQLFLSKDILYPPLKELTTKYPQWLEDNKSSISEDDYSRYAKQLEIMNKICSEMEASSDETKSERFNQIFVLMQQMQEYGHPPESLVGEPFEMPSFF